jgi:lipopolysaccharide transport system permease protein
MSVKSRVKVAVESRGLIANLTLRELRTKYRRSFLGWTWSLLNPLATVALYSFVFGKLFGSVAPTGNPSGLTQFSLYLLCGIIPWNFFSTVTNMSTGAILGNSGLVRKVAFPRQALVVSQVLFMMVQSSIEFGLVAVILLLAGSPLLPWLPMVALLLFLLAVFAAGIALAVSVLTVYFRDLPYLWTIVIQVWFFITPIVYDYDAVKDRLNSPAQALISWNPMTGFIRSFRHCLFDGTHPDFKVLGALTLCSAASLLMGSVVFVRFNRRLAEEA